MLPSSSDQLPSDQNELARIAANKSETVERREQAFGKLAQWILKLAEQKDHEFYGRLGEEFVGEALTHVWKHFERFDDSKGKFEAWCSAVVTRRAIDVWRQRLRKHGWQASEALLENQPDMADSRQQSSEEADRVLKLLIAERRAVLEEMQWQPGSASGVDYFAVFLLQLRLAIAANISADIASNDLELPDEMSYLLAQYLPWRKQEQSLRFKTAWPTLREIWLSLKERLDQPPHLVSIAGLCDVLTQALKGTITVTPDLWYQWLKRAKKMAKGRVDSATWDLFFSVWLPDRKLRPGEQPLGLEGKLP